MSESYFQKQNQKELKEKFWWKSQRKWNEMTEKLMKLNIYFDQILGGISRLLSASRKKSKSIENGRMNEEKKKKK